MLPDELQRTLEVARDALRGFQPQIDSFNAAMQPMQEMLERHQAVIEQVTRLANLPAIPAVDLSHVEHFNRTMAPYLESISKQVATFAREQAAPSLKGLDLSRLRAFEATAVTPIPVATTTVVHEHHIYVHLVNPAETPETADTDIEGDPSDG